MRIGMEQNQWRDYIFTVINDSPNEIEDGEDSCDDFEMPSKSFKVQIILVFKVNIRHIYN